MSITPEQQAIMDQMTVSDRLDEYRRRAGELTPSELAQAISLLRKARTSASKTRTAKAAAAKAPGKGLDDLMNDLEGLA